MVHTKKKRIGPFGGSASLFELNDAFTNEDVAFTQEKVFMEAQQASKDPSDTSSFSENTQNDAEDTTSDYDMQRHVVLGLYVVMIFLWVILTIVLGVAPWTLRQHTKTSALNWFVFFIPILVMGIGMMTIYYVDDVCDLNNNLRGGNVLYLGILVAIPLFGMLEANYKGDRKHFATLVLSSISIAVLSQFDIWGTSEWTCLINHLSSNMKTLSVGLLLFILVLYVNNGNYVVTQTAASQLEKQQMMNFTSTF
jgi:hypothetical protein